MKAVDESITDLVHVIIGQCAKERQGQHLGCHSVSDGQVCGGGAGQLPITTVVAAQRVKVFAGDDVEAFEPIMELVAVQAGGLRVDPQYKVLQAVGGVGGYLEQLQTGLVSQSCLVQSTDVGAALALCVHMTQHDAAQGGLQFAHLAVDARHDDFIFVFDAKVLEQFDTFFEVGVVHCQRPTLCCVKELGGVKAEHGGITIAADDAAVDAGTEGVGAVVDQAQAVGAGQGVKGLHITRYAVNMHAQHTACFGRDEVFHPARVDAQGVGINISKNRGDIVPAQHMGGGRKGKGTGDDLARETQRLTGNDEGNGAVVEQAQVGRTQPAAKLGFPGPGAGRRRWPASRWPRRPAVALCIRPGAAAGAG